MDEIPYRRRLREAWANADPALKLALETGHMLFYPKAYVTSKGFVDRSGLRRHPTIGLQCAVLGLPLAGLSEAEQDAAVLAAYAEEQAYWARYHAERTAPTTAERAANTSALLANLNLNLGDNL